MLFEDWKKKVNELIFNAINLTLDDLPDEDYYIFWDCKYNPEDVAKILLIMYTNNKKKKNVYFQTFDEWKKEIDDNIMKVIGLHCIDLPDYDYWMEFSNNKRSSDVISNVLSSYEDSQCSNKRRKIEV